MRTYIADKYMTCDKCGRQIKPGDKVFNMPARPGDVVVMAAHASCPLESPQ